MISTNRRGSRKVKAEVFTEDTYWLRGGQMGDGSSLNGRRLRKKRATFAGAFSGTRQHHMGEILRCSGGNAAPS